MQAMTDEIDMIRKKVYSFDELIEYLKLLHEAGGDDAVVQQLLILGEVSKIDDSLDEICYIEEELSFLFGTRGGTLLKKIG